MLWDVGTFWPRATHPLAPPSYGERAIPDLLNRVNHLTRREHDLVILSGHSQGAIIAATLVMQLDPPQRSGMPTHLRRPLRRLYSRFFPGYFDLDTLQDIGAQLCPTAHGPPTGHEWAWREPRPPSDYIGGPVFRLYPAVKPTEGEPGHWG